LDDVNKQDLTKDAGFDPLFPPNSKSGYDRWMSLQDVRGSDFCGPIYTEIDGPKTDHCERIFWYGKTKDRKDCQSKCDAIHRCNYYSVWTMDGETHCTLATECDQKEKKKHTLQIFRKNCTLPPGVVRVIGPSGINYTDIGQGAKDSSYLLAGLMAIAHSHPEMLDAMFVERQLWPKNVYKTKWFYHGREIIVSVDNMIPAKGVGQPSFAQFSSTGEVWPMIIEKAWAKLHSSYKHIETAYQMDFMSAITQAPMEFVYHGSENFEVTNDILWKKLESATSDGFAITASTTLRNEKEKHSGLVAHQQYAVLNVGMHRGKRSVMCANPRKPDTYTGDHSAADASTGKSIFWMTIEEYHRAFGHTSICKILKGYKLISVPIKPEKDIEIKAEVSTAKPFWVSLQDPTDQMDEHMKAGGCKKEWYDFDTKLQVHRDPDLHEAKVVGGSRWGLGHILSAEVGNVPRDKTWLIKASAKSKASDKRSLVDNLYVMIYAIAGAFDIKAP